MATQSKRLRSNVVGDFYVDSSCIDCATCRWMVPEVFDQADAGQSKVHSQPESPELVQRSLQALIACPTGSIGTEQKHDIKAVQKTIPTLIADNVYHCGYHSEDSFGAASYLIKRPQGNVLVDSPRFNRSLVRQLEQLGGVKTLFLTHRDDVADHEKFAEHFGCERVLHKQDVSPGTRGVERQIEGQELVSLDDELLIVPVPGHTRGSACLIYQERFLFSGDHVAWSSKLGHIYAFRGACWFSWAELKKSMRRLAEHRFEWILPGHGWPCHFEGEQMAMEMQRCLDWVESR